MVCSEKAPLGRSGVHGTNDLRGRLIMRMCWIFPSHQISTAVGAVHQVNTVSAQCQSMHTHSQAHMQQTCTRMRTHTNTRIHTKMNTQLKWISSLISLPVMPIPSLFPHSQVPRCHGFIIHKRLINWQEMDVSCWCTCGLYIMEWMNEQQNEGVVRWRWGWGGATSCMH